MGWSGGTYTKGNAGSGGWVGDAGLGIGIEASRHDTQDNDFATGINTCLTKDGQNTPTANLPMGGYKHTGVGSATAGDEYLSYGQLLDVTRAVTTSGTAPNYTVTLTPTPSAYFEGMTFTIKPHQDLGTGAPTLDVNGLGAKALKTTIATTSVRDVFPFELNQRSYYTVTYNATGDYFKVQAPTYGYYPNNFTPSVTSNSGTCTLNPTTNDNWYQWVNSSLIRVHYQVNFNLSGASSAWVAASLPQTAASHDSNTIGSAYGNASGYAGPSVSVFITGGTLRFYRNDSTNWAIDSSFILYGTVLYNITT